MAFPALRVLPMGSTAVVRATRLPVALSLDRRLPQALLAPLCGARVCTHAPVQPSPAAVPRLPGGVVRGLQASLLGRPLSLPRGTQTSLCPSLTPHRSGSVPSASGVTAKLAVHLRAHAGREIDYERDVSSRFVQNRRAAGTVLGKGDPTRRPLEQRAELSPCPGASPRLTAHSTPSSSAGRGSFTRGPPPSPAGCVLLCPRGLPLGVPWPPRPGRPPGAVSLRPVWFSAPATWGPAAFRVPGCCLLWIASSPPAPNRTRACTEAPAPRACGPRCPLASASP